MLFSDYRSAYGCESGGTAPGEFYEVGGGIAPALYVVGSGAHRGSHAVGLRWVGGKGFLDCQFGVESSE